jgi:hypothetical protein
MGMSAIRTLQLKHSDVDPAPAADARTQVVAARFRDVMQALGLDLEDPNLAGTPLRVARAYRELFSGLDPGTEPGAADVPERRGLLPDRGRDRHPVPLPCARTTSCRSSALPTSPIFPKDRVVGLSKLARVVEHYARRPQIQERLTEQVIELLESRLRPGGSDGGRPGAAHVHGDARRRPAGRDHAHERVARAFADARTRQEFLDLLPTSAP